MRLTDRCQIERITTAAAPIAIPHHCHIRNLSFKRKIDKMLVSERSPTAITGYTIPGDIGAVASRITIRFCKTFMHPAKMGKIIALERTILFVSLLSLLKYTKSEKREAEKIAKSIIRLPC